MLDANKIYKRDCTAGMQEIAPGPLDKPARRIVGRAGGEYILLHATAGVKIVSPIAFALAIGLSFVELLIQVLQAYVFTVLTANYIGGALAEGH